MLAGSFFYDLLCLGIFFSVPFCLFQEYTGEISSDGGTGTNLRRFVYFLMVLLTVLKVWPKLA